MFATTALGGRRFVVTGAAGRLGRVVVAQLVDAGAEVVAVDRVQVHDPPCGTLTREMDMTDAVEMAEIMDGCDAVIHLAALPSPHAGPPSTVFANNTQATFSVLLAAEAVGLSTAVIASSVSAYGMTYAATPFAPAYVPVDENHPLLPADWYALSKQTDENTAAMFARRSSLSVVALRFHWISTVKEQLRRVDKLRDDPSLGARELWGYVDVRDAARACLLAAESRGLGFQAFVICARDSISKEPTSALLRRFWPSVPETQRLEPDSSAWSSAKAREMLDFLPMYTWRRPVP